MRIVNKFGGEILADPKLAELGVRWIKGQVKQNKKPIVVVSALGGVTDALIKLFETEKKGLLEEIEGKHKEWMENFGIEDKALKKKIEILKKNLENDLKKARGHKFHPFLRDRILSYGEKWSSLLFTQLLIKNGISALGFTGEELGIITDNNFGQADIRYEQSRKNVRRKIEKLGKIPVVTGFIGKAKTGQTATLGRGGSDTTATFLASALGAEKVILWKNVPGVLSADPRLVKNPKLIKSLSYEEAEEAGKVIHYKALEFVKQSKIKIEVAFIKDPSKRTTIGEFKSKKWQIKIISLKENLALFVIRGEKIVKPGALFEIAQSIATRGINMVLIRNTKESLYIVVEKNIKEIEDCYKEIKDLGYEIWKKKVGMISAVGRINREMVEKFNHLLFKHFPKAELGAFPYKNCLRLEAVVENSKVKRLVNLFHKKFIEKS